jgi:hypothetical protein
VPHPARVSRLGYPFQALGQAGALTGQQRAVTGRQVPQLLQAGLIRDDDRAGTVSAAIMGLNTHMVLETVPVRPSKR